jgi:Tfp pilus assembly protein PilN
MIQFNLLPDIKIQYLKAKRQKHVIVLVSTVASIVSLGIFILLLTTVFVLQKKNISDLDKDIKSSSQQLQSVDDLNKILTVQNQLGALTNLHDSKVVSSRLLDYLTQVTPAAASISKLEVDYVDSTMTITGNAPALSMVNTYTDTLKFTKYVTGQDEEEDEKNAFSEVVLTSFNRDSQGTTYEISFRFDPVIFDNSEQVALDVPKIITTRSETDKPAEIFQGVE